MKNKNYSRSCPICKKDLFYSQQSSRDLAERKGSACGSCSAKEVRSRPEVKEKSRSCGKKMVGALNPFFGRHHTQESKNKREITIQKNNSRQVFQTERFRGRRRELTTGKNNPMHGKSLYEHWLLRYGKDEAELRQSKLNEKRSRNVSGKGNPMYDKRPPSGSGGGWSGWYNGWYFRSLRELTYVLKRLEPENQEWESAEKISIPYLMDGIERTYCPDFKVGQILVEVKPRKMQNTRENVLKRSAALDYCNKNGMTYIVEDIEPIGIDELFELCESKRVILLEKWNKRLCKLMKKKQ